jgi:hypothetical protein
VLRRYEVTGNWYGRPGVSRPAVIIDYSAGLLFTATDDGEEVFGPPEDFRSTDGESGTSILCRILCPPSTDSLRYGAIREVIAAAHSVALFGFGETRAWDGPNDYIIDTGEGSCGVVRFVGLGCVAAIINYDPWREFDLAKAMILAPPALQPTLEDVCRLPFLNSPAQLRISSLFWSEGGALQAPEPWPVVYKFGGELLRHELLDDELWRTEAGSHYDLDEPTLALCVSLARRRVASSGTIDLTDDVFRRIVPKKAPHHAEAAQLLSDIGLRRPNVS